MDENHVVAGQVPDENYIERLFPKCPPKQYNGKRSLNSNKAQGKRQTRPKVHQHSRRELEARRNKVNLNRKEIENNNNNNNNGSVRNSINNSNNNITTSNNANSSESSDDNGTIRSRLKRSNSSGQYSSNGQQHQKSSTISSTGGTSIRRSGKYTASQNLLQRLERSQSSYNNGNHNQQDLSKADDQQSRGIQEQPAPPPPGRGIVKSSSSFAFINEQSSVPSTNNNNNNGTGTGYINDSAMMIKHKNFELDQAQRTMTMNDGGAKIQSNGLNNGDLFDSNNNVVNNEPNYIQPGCKSILRGSSKKQEQPEIAKLISEEGFTAMNNDCRARGSIINDFKSSSSSSSSVSLEPLNSLLSKIDKRNNRNSRSMEIASQDENENSPPSIFDTGVPCALTETNVNGVSSSSSSSPSTNLITADAVGDQRNNNNKSNSSELPNEDLISISNNNNNEAILIDTNSPTNTNKANSSAKKNDGLNGSNIDDSSRKDDEKFINLFVYDSATNQTLQKTQILAATSQQPDVKQEPQSIETNNSLYNNNKSSRYILNRDETTPNKASGDLANLSYNNSVETTGLVNLDEISNQDQCKNEVVSSQVNADELVDKNQSPPNRKFKSRPPSQTQRTPNVVSVVHHRESQKLLATELNEEGCSDLNDASTEELCSIGDSLGEAPIKISCNKRQESESSNDSGSLPNHNRPLSSHRSSVPTAIGTLQTVDESAEINLEESSVCDDIKTDTLLDKTTFEEPTADTMSTTNHPKIITKKAFVPPGYPQRIRPQPVESPTTSSNTLTNGIPTVDKKQYANSNEVLPERRQQNVIDTPEQNSHKESFPDRSKTNYRTDGQRVKFDDENLVSIKDEPSNQIKSERFSTDRQQHVNLSALLPSPPSVKQPPALLNRQLLNSNVFDCVSESSSVSGQPAELPEGELSIGLNRISLANSYGDEEENNVEILSSKTAIKNGTSPPDDNQPSQHTTNRNYTNSDLAYPQHVIDPVVSSLQHHKLPNETSHYSIVRSTNNTDISAVPTRSSSIHFNTLSDGESGPDEPNPMVSSSNQRSRSLYTLVARKCDQGNVASGNGRNSSGMLSCQSPIKTSGINASGSNMNDDDLTPTTKTALIFPRLDEGLSSEAESGEDDVEEDDERAVDADVDADDDDDDDDDEDDDDDDDEDVDDDDVGNHNLSLTNGRSSQALQPGSAECFIRPQQQQQQQQQQPQTKTHYRSMNTLQQQAHNPTLTQPDQSNIHNVRVPGLAYGGYTTSQETIDINDLKSMTNYSNQNGQSSNYWMDSSSQQQQQANLSPQPSTSFAHRNHNNNNNNNNGTNNPITKQNNNSFNRDEAKVTNRLSSDTDNETDRLLGSQRSDQLKSLANSDNIASSSSSNSNNTTDPQTGASNGVTKNASSKEVLIEGVLFNVKYLGSTHSDCEGRSEKEDRIHQAEMAVQEVKFRNGESQAATEVQLFISTEKIIVLEDKQRQIMMDHSLRTISYIADIGDAIVLIVRKKNNSNEANEMGRLISKISCHVFESKESHTITKAISHAFQAAYAELLKANNGVGETLNHILRDGLEFQEVLNSQEMSTDELEMFARKENQREVVVPKEEGEVIGISIVESGWGSVLPTVVISSMKQSGPAYRCKRLSIGDQILSINGISCVGLPLAECQEILRRTKRQRVARLSIVPCPITVEVKIKRPDIKYQLGFSVQNGVICSLLRGGIAERGGVRVGHRIMSINGITVVGEKHDKIVSLLANSVGEIRMKTCLTSLYRIILGQETPVHF